VAQNTISRRDSVVTGIFKPDVIALPKEPMVTTPVKNGSVTIAPGIGVNILLGVVDSYNCATGVVAKRVVLR